MYRRHNDGTKSFYPNTIGYYEQTATQYDKIEKRICSKFF